MWYRKEEIACNKQFLLFSQCLPQLDIFSASKYGIVRLWVNSLPNNKIFDLSKFKAHADNKMNGTPVMKFVLENLENIF